LAIAMIIVGVLGAYKSVGAPTIPWETT
jgi:hypothetical protein